jgi:hypothetical protein
MHSHPESAAVESMSVLQINLGAILQFSILVIYY